MVTLGIDEVGRGCLAGPLVVGAVILNQPISNLKDSKLLSQRQRMLLDQDIRLLAKDYSLGLVSASEIDNLGLSKATSLAIKRALAKINTNYDEIIIDGNINYLNNNKKAKAIIKADQLIPAVSAASIIAKVARDNLMVELSSKYPQYGFAKHVGYGTKYHLDMLQLYGLSKEHRRSFKPVKQILKYYDE